MECDADGVCRLPRPDVEQPLANKKAPGHVLPLLFDDASTSTVLHDDRGIQQGAEAISGKIIGLYFSAGWCPPCRKFSPELSKFRAAHSQDFTVIFVSSDHSEAEMMSFIAGKGFLHVPFHGKARQAIQMRLGVSMLPTLVIIDGTSGAILTDWGRAAVTRNPAGCLEGWRAGGHGCSWAQLVTGGSCSLQ